MHESENPTDTQCWVLHKYYIRPLMDPSSARANEIYFVLVKVYFACIKMNREWKKKKCVFANVCFQCWAFWQHWNSTAHNSSIELGCSRVLYFVTVHRVPVIKIRFNFIAENDSVDIYGSIYSWRFLLWSFISNTENKKIFSILNFVEILTIFAFNMLNDHKTHTLALDSSTLSWWFQGF